MLLGGCGANRRRPCPSAGEALGGALLRSDLPSASILLSRSLPVVTGHPSGWLRLAQDHWPAQESAIQSASTQRRPSQVRSTQRRPSQLAWLHRRPVQSSVDPASRRPSRRRPNGGTARSSRPSGASSSCRRPTCGKPSDGGPVPRQPVVQACIGRDPPARAVPAGLQPIGAPAGDSLSHWASNPPAGLRGQLVPQLRRLAQVALEHRLGEACPRSWRRRGGRSSRRRLGVVRGRGAVPSPRPRRGRRPGGSSVVGQPGCAYAESISRALTASGVSSRRVAMTSAAAADVSAVDIDVPEPRK